MPHAETDPLIRLLNRAIETALRLDPEKAAELACLENKTLRLEIAGSPFFFYLLPHSGKLTASSTLEHPPDVVVRVSPSAFLADHLTGQGTQHLEIKGDVRIAQQLLDILKDVRPSLAEWCEPFLRGSPARMALAATLIRRGEKVGTWLTRGLRHLLQNSVDYAIHERSWLITKTEQTALADDAAQLRDDLERLTLRIERLP